MREGAAAYLAEACAYLSTALMSLLSAVSGHMPITGKPNRQVQPLHSVSQQLPGTCLPAETSS
jgi:hypothetical protein